MRMLDSIMLFMALQTKNFFTDEEGAVDIVAIVVLIGIAVILAVVFKDAISGLLESLMRTITQNATNAVNGN